MLKINSFVKEQLTKLISCLMVVGVFFASYPSASLNADPKLQSEGDTIFWFHVPVFLSVSMALLLILTFAVTKPRNLLSNLFLRKDLLALSFIFIYLFAGFINSENYSYIFERLRIKLPFIILPICASALSITRKGFHLILFVFLICTFLIGFYTFIHYIIYFDQINAAYLRSKMMPTPMNHVRFSILAALGSYSSYYLIKNNFSPSKFYRTVIIFVGIFLFLFVHIYSIRSGIMALYGIAFTEIFIRTFKEKAYKKGTIAFICLIIIGFISINVSPTLKNKIINTRQDISVYQNKGFANNNSLTTRLISYEIAYDLFKENKLLGCGLGDLEIKNNALFKAKYPEIDIPIIPHNEFLYYLASMGILGLLSFTFCFFFPLFYNKNYKNEFLLMVYIILSLSFLSEPMIETQLGVACTIIFIILPLMVKKEERFP